MNMCCRGGMPPEHSARLRTIKEAAQSLQRGSSPARLCEPPKPLPQCCPLEGQLGAHASHTSRTMHASAEISSGPEAAAALLMATLAGVRLSLVSRPRLVAQRQGDRQPPASRARWRCPVLASCLESPRNPLLALHQRPMHKQHGMPPPAAPPQRAPHALHNAPIREAPPHRVARLLHRRGHRLAALARVVVVAQLRVGAEAA